MISPFKTQVYVRFGESPKRDWYIVLSLFATSLILVALIDAGLFLAFSKEGGSAMTEASPITLDRDEVIDAAKDIRDSDMSASRVSESLLLDPARPAPAIAPALQ